MNGGILACQLGRQLFGGEIVQLIEAGRPTSDT